METLQCPGCGSRDAININLTLDDGERVSFYSCHRCDRRWWYKDGEAVPLPDVLEMARKKKDAPGA